jgi:hypothetical protein
MDIDASNITREMGKDSEAISIRGVSSRGCVDSPTGDGAGDGSDGEDGDVVQDDDKFATPLGDTIEQPISLPHEILFVGVICLSQFLTRE